MEPKEEANHLGNLNVLMVLYANSGIDDLIRCYAIKLICYPSVCLCVGSPMYEGSAWLLKGNAL